MESSVPVTHLELFQEWLKFKKLSRSECRQKLKNYLINERKVDQPMLEDSLKKIIKNIEHRWKESNRDSKRFEEKNRLWLECNVSFSNKEDLGASSRGRPEKCFEDCGIRTQQRKAQALTSTYALKELSFATQMSMRKFGKRAAATVLHEIMNSPEIAKKFKSSDQARQLHKPIPLTPEEALSLIVNTKSSKSTYLAYRRSAKECNANIYPSWHKILAAKKACYPDDRYIKVSETSAQIELEALLHLTARRLFNLQAEVLKSIPTSKLTLICKWGIDGSSGQSNYGQLVRSEGNDSSVLILSFVPLQLRASDYSNKIVWQNPVPSSTRFCRAIKFVFAKETTECTKNEIDLVKDKIKNLKPLIYEEKTISFCLVLTMVDGNVCHALTDTSSTQSCYLCKAKPSEMNDLNCVVSKTPFIENYSFGLSTLHSWIRFFECCLHVGYRIELKSWQVRGEKKEKFLERKNKIIEGLRKELGILVDKPKPGYGSTNTGNTARTFFRNARKSAEVTGVDEEIISRFHVILQTISCGYEVDVDKFSSYSFKTAELFVGKYPWYNMPTSVHKVLVHGGDIISHAILPIGQLGEEAQEAKNKDFKFIREHGSRKDSPIHTNEDLLHYFLLSSDPVISHLSLKRHCTRQKLQLSGEVLNLLKSPSLQPNEDDSEDEDSLSESD